MGAVCLEDEGLERVVLKQGKKVAKFKPRTNAYWSRDIQTNAKRVGSRKPTGVVPLSKGMV